LIDELADEQANRLHNTTNQIEHK